MSLLDSRSLLPLLALLAACATKDASKSANASDSTHTAAAAKPHQMTVVATDYKFDAPDQVPAGMMTIHLVDNGQEMHHVAFVKLNDGKTVADVEQALKTQGPMPSWAVDYGGVNPPHPGGGMATTTQMLEPGNYALVCFVPSADGTPHFAKGMIKAFTVGAAPAGATATAPVADVDIKLVDYGFDLSKPLTAGTHTFAVTNGASQPHEAELVKLAPGKTVEQLLGWMQKPAGPPPASAIGGVAGFIGDTNYFTADITPGQYALICFLPDAKDGKPHFMHGMTKTITVM